MAASGEPRHGRWGEVGWRSVPVAVVLVWLAVGVAGTGAAGARPSGSCATTIKLGFGPYLEKEPPSANFELRAVVHPACTREPHGRCVGEVKKGRLWARFSTVPVLPASGRCRFILSSPDTFSPATVRVRYLPAAGFAASRATIVLRDDATGPFPPDLGATGAPHPGSGSSAGAGPDGGTKIVGVVFLDTARSSGTRASVPAGARIYPPGATVSGSAPCQTTPTNGQLYLVFDYSGTPTAGEIELTAPDGSGGTVAHAPIELDVNAGTTVQFLGVPAPPNGGYKLSLQLLGLHPQTLKATFTLALAC